MPKTSIDYSKTVMYVIRPIDWSVKLLYVGSTTDFIRRKWQHKHKCHNPAIREYNYKLYKLIRENGGWSNFTMEIIEVFPCNNVVECEMREREIYHCLRANMNSRVPRLTEEEIKNYSAIANAKRKKYPKTECPCGGCYLYQNKNVHLASQKHQNYVKDCSPSSQ